MISRNRRRTALRAPCPGSLGGLPHDQALGGTLFEAPHRTPGHDLVAWRHRPLHISIGIQHELRLRFSGSSQTKGDLTARRGGVLDIRETPGRVPRHVHLGGLEDDLE